MGEQSLSGHRNRRRYGVFSAAECLGIVWRANKKILRWMEATGGGGAAMPNDLVMLSRQSALTSRFSFYLTFFIIFFMGAASHFPLFGA
jgi:hypothetical protein